MLFFPMLPPGEGHLDVSEPQAGQRGGRQGRSLGKTPGRVLCVSTVAPSRQHDSGMQPSHLGFSWQKRGPGCEEKTSLELGLIGLVLVQNAVRHTPHRNCAWGGERAPMLGETLGHFLCREHI